MKENLLVSFSGGKTSAFMTHHILNNLTDRYNILVVFSDRTLDKCKKCGNKIRYHRDDGFWDNFNGEIWTPFNCKVENDHHEPINHVCDKKGFYHKL